ncbi:response regulator receiver and ANTAR domain protein [Desulfonispora thiosulfatigenes DSM 11270]|uniref:Stage 0 sporulation protein A homolog n=1 Tax=Desulfonispora thiosulfatigenes DSM 11270 TaxID=656914 RepID=A0A1W1V0C5_DESTI|nr:ANTAR domain-containing protein [Desulfonispora thiosulfatigenes]SMB86812.1 response regulator receiver and ANTAR domain protein [Desulfonispora thiosulfatigenes DSM 11270]
MRKILLAVNNTKQDQKIKNILTSHGYKVNSIVNDAYLVLRTLRSKEISLSIIDTDLSGMSGLQLAKIISEEKLGPVILIVQGELSFGDEIPSIFGVITKPIQEYTLINTLKLALNNFENQRHLEEEVNSLKDTLESRKLIEKAKGILMKKGFSEEQAYDKLRKLSMEKRVSMKKIAKAIITNFS